MEILVFAFVAMTKLYRREGKFVREPHTFQPLDVQALRDVYKTRKSLRSGHLINQSRMWSQRHADSQGT